MPHPGAKPYQAIRIANTTNEIAKSMMPPPTEDAGTKARQVNLRQKRLLIDEALTGIA